MTDLDVGRTYLSCWAEIDRLRAEAEEIEIRIEQDLQRLRANRGGWDALARQLADERSRREHADREYARVRRIVEAAREMVRQRNEHHGAPSNPDWWQGWDFALVAAVEAAYPPDGDSHG